MIIRCGKNIFFFYFSFASVRYVCLVRVNFFIRFRRNVTASYLKRFCIWTTLIFPTLARKINSNAVAIQFFESRLAKNLPKPLRYVIIEKVTRFVRSLYSTVYTVIKRDKVKNKNVTKQNISQEESSFLSSTWFYLIFKSSEGEVLHNLANNLSSELRCRMQREGTRMSRRNETTNASYLLVLCHFF